jgi:curved DNA-binding protein CbpA
MLVERVAARHGGNIKATRGKLRRIFCIDQGWIVFAASNVLEEQYAEHLVEQRILLPAQKASFVEEAARSQTKLARVIARSGVVADTVLRRALEEHARHLLLSTLEWSEGAFEFEPGRPNLDGEATVRLSPLRIVLEYAQRHPPRLDAVRMRIGPPDGKPRAVAERVALLADLDLDAVGNYLLGRCDGSLKIPEVVAGSPGDEHVTFRTLHGLVLLGALQIGRHAEEVASGPALDREECLAILSRSDGDHYAVLGLSRQGSADDVRKSYYALARRYHPDRFRAGPLADLLVRMEGYFTKVTEAYNTLSHADLRAEYDDALAAPAADPEAKLSETSHLARQNYLRGKALLEKKRYAEAATFLENAARLDSTQAVYHLDLGVLLARNPRRRPDAERELIRAAELAPADPVAYMELGQLYQRAGRLEHAARMFREVLRWDPENAEASALLAGVGAAEAPMGGLLQRILG